ncbi:hypothetical protein [Nonomuraea cavernae]|uniref:Uncharacterized protein n=1 Tax=Nonomuraea cavernae TaxID=2045107 RepID=A0A918DI47_9ACTN|nr:hypothetical protein [Nonomuraea cavernae]MCA2185449.1 hypothetical protein [Nonomuraea cavernae]GGO66507.1 hypothetical protein GCM10012289_20690 [Nonomuraea cavernae]
MSSDETRTVRLTVEVADCGIAGLQDRELDGYADTPAQSVGFIEVEKGWVTLRITHQRGPADFTVTIADRDPGADLATYEDIVEISYVSRSGEVEMSGFAHDDVVMCPLPPLHAGPGTYRMRYHVKDMDWEGAREDGVDDHYLQIWPAPFEDPVVVKATSDVAQYFSDPEKFKHDRGW